MKKRVEICESASSGKLMFINEENKDRQAVAHVDEQSRGLFYIRETPHSERHVNDRLPLLKKKILSFDCMYIIYIRIQLRVWSSMIVSPN